MKQENLVPNKLIRLKLPSLKDYVANVPSVRPLPEPLHSKFQLGYPLTVVITYMKNLLDSDWLRKECSSSVTRVQNV